MNPGVKQQIRAAKRGQPSILEGRFALMWRAIDGPELVTELKFHPIKQWRFDFAHPATKIAIEIEGGTLGHSRHTKPEGYQNDCEKYNEAQFLGWKTFRLTSGMINLAHLESIKALILRGGDR